MKIFDFLNGIVNKVVLNDFEHEHIQSEIEKQVQAQVSLMLSKEDTHVFIDIKNDGDVMIMNPSFDTKILILINRNRIIRDFDNSIDNAVYNPIFVDAIKETCYTYASGLFEKSYKGIQENRLVKMRELERGLGTNLVHQPA